MMDVLNFLILFGSGIIYLFFYARVQQRYFKGYGENNRPFAVTILLMASVISASVNLVHIASLAEDANRFFLGGGQYVKCLLFCVSFFAAMWLLSFGMFHISFLIIGWLTKENEKDELSKNNIELALQHGVILIALSFVVAPPMIKIASGFIPYPELPF